MTNAGEARDWWEAIGPSALSEDEVIEHLRNGSMWLILNRDGMCIAWALEASARAIVAAHNTDAGEALGVAAKALKVAKDKFMAIQMEIGAGNMRLAKETIEAHQATIAQLREQLTQAAESYVVALDVSEQHWREALTSAEAQVASLQAEVEGLKEDHIRINNILVRRDEQLIALRTELETAARVQDLTATQLEKVEGFHKKAVQQVFDLRTELQQAQEARDWRKQLNETDEGAAKRLLYHLRAAIMRAQFRVAPVELDRVLALLDEADANLIALQADRDAEKGRAERAEAALVLIGATAGPASSIQGDKEVRRRMAAIASSYLDKYVYGDADAALSTPPASETDDMLTRLANMPACTCKGGWVIPGCPLHDTAPPADEAK